MQPPTYHKLNKFTRSFQAIVDAYGVATYQEVNPTPYTIITFPFLFAVMFGDAGHGLIMALFALCLIIFEKKLANFKRGGEMFVMIFDGRYIVFLMGLFSIYTGLIYNDVFSKSLNIFGSSWDPTYTETGLNVSATSIAGCCHPGTNCVILGGPQGYTSIFPREAMAPYKPYPFGLDPIWSVADNKLLFTNSYKMKMSIILGIGQMLFGVILSIFNHVHFKRFINIFVEFIPQLLFLMCLFGWLVFLIFYKWCYHYEDPNTTPSLLITLINMFLEIANAPKVPYPGDPTNSENEYSVFGPSQATAAVQRSIHVILVIVVIICVPWMLCIKPFYLLYKHKREMRRMGGYQHSGYTALPDSEPGSSGSDDSADETTEIVHHGRKESAQAVGKKVEGSESKRRGGGEHGEFDFSEIFIHQAIHTIEYCLSSISNTASYLRLWALSLAHAELSEVLWTMVMNRGIGTAVQVNSPVIGTLFLAYLFAFWAVLTVGILLVMEGLSAFLHALRLHWVEFQSKFYDGSGFKFMPFSFEAILMGEDE